MPQYHESAAVTLLRICPLVAAISSALVMVLVVVEKKDQAKEIFKNLCRVSTVLEGIDTPISNSIPNDIVLTDDIDNAIRVLTNHIRTVVDDSSRIVPANSDRKELPKDVRELIRAKNAALRASKYPTCVNRSHVRALQRKVRARMQEFYVRFVPAGHIFRKLPTVTSTRVQGALKQPTQPR
ncbi:hypothetical protein EVAR_57880_1 [Eumeta japonica]|uniref:Uncharacterized protein n=1 Tax=Eumeta variegata TaxID=151549 RepID=A0A4C1ZHZ6_EUMVA|nr:hypothetical protein EVAR_57880_1 [Eumeta japonica]